MTIAIARQPILDRSRELHGYELLFRDGIETALDELGPPQGNRATEQVISNSFLMFGIDALTGGCPAFINVTRDVLLGRHMHLLPPERVVPEVLENVLPDPEVIAACRELRAAGFRIALDDVDGENRGALVDVADIIKVDFQRTTARQQADLAGRLGGCGKTMLAEKVEEYAEQIRAESLGYELFQGYFFAKPETLSQQEIPSSRLHCMELLGEINQPSVSFDDLHDIIKKDMSLTYRLLRYLNSASFGLRSEIRSIRHALTMLGEREVRKWATLVAMAVVGDSKPKELLMLALTRARFLEAVAPVLSLQDEDQDLFLLGALSLLDAVLDQPLARCLNGIHLNKPIREALLGRPGQYGRILELVVCYERGAWSALAYLANEMSLEPGVIPVAYLRASEWAQRAFPSVMAGTAKEQA